jgi:hypothetical protein
VHFALSATPVVLQAWNCTVGMLAKFILMDGTLPSPPPSPAEGSALTLGCSAGMEQEAVDYFWVSASIVSIGAPMGSFLSSFVHRIILGVFLYVADVVQFIAALIIIPLNKPYAHETAMSRRNTTRDHVVTRTFPVVWRTGW